MNDFYSMNDPLDNVINFLKRTDELAVGSSVLSVFKKYAQSVEQLDQLGRLFHDVKDYQNAIDCVEKTIAIAQTPQQLYAARSNLAKLYNHINRPDKAILYIKANLNINPQDYESKMEMLFSHYLLSEFDESLRILETLLADPNVPKNVQDRCRFNLGSYQLDRGEFKEGLINFIDVGHKIGIWPTVKLPLPVWSGDIQEGKTVAILAEGGIGDEVINVRFAKKIESLGMNAVFVTSRPETRSLFERNGFKVASSVDNLPTDSMAILSMYLPIALGLDKFDLWDDPYLKPDPVYVEKWKSILPKGKKVSIRWSGNPHYEQDLHRSLPLEQLNRALSFDRSDVTFVSVQKDNNSDIVKYPEVFDAAPYLETLEDLLACLSLMDYNISSCTSVAHICAAAGLPITVCPPVATYYTWLGDAKWYGDSCHVLRQKKWKDWSHLDKLIDTV